jgi:4-O-beta-D-mannosyl-D-glucose phosphorylase
MTDLCDLTKVIHKPAGYLMAPEGEERVGDVSNVLFSNGWIADDDGTVYIYYASSDTRIHVATTTVDQLVDYTMCNPADRFSSAETVRTLNRIIKNNQSDSLLRSILSSELKKQAEK